MPVRSITDRVAHQIRYRSSRGQIHIDLLKYFLCFQVQRGRRNREDDAPIAGTLTTRSTQTTKRQDVGWWKDWSPGGDGTPWHTHHPHPTLKKQADRRDTVFGIASRFCPRGGEVFVQVNWSFRAIGELISGVALRISYGTWLALTKAN